MAGIEELAESLSRLLVSLSVSHSSCCEIAFAKAALVNGTTGGGWMSFATSDLRLSFGRVMLALCQSSLQKSEAQVDGSRKHLAISNLFQV